MSMIYLRKLPRAGIERANMKINKYDAKLVAKETMAKLKDFQCATVNRVIELFRNGQNRVLVADEVGLGKTIVARGVIARFAELRKEEKDNLVKVAYICSNQGIARQNVQKLCISELINTELNANEARLSMQHLKIAEKENDSDILNGYIQIIPLTPETSFRMTDGMGLRVERALIFVILERMIDDDYILTELRQRLFAPTREGIRESEEWGEQLTNFRQRVSQCEIHSGGKYPRLFISRLKKRNVVKIAINLSKTEGSRNKDAKDCIRKLRQIFAEESAAMLQPDLVIMDEFQRFRFLIDDKENSEASILAKRFLKVDSNSFTQQPRVLLLSATPYKLYATTEEVIEAGHDEEYHEFLELIDFIFGAKSSDVREVWSEYTNVLRDSSIKYATVLNYKTKAENILSEGICRTERVSVMDDGDYITDEASKTPIEISKGDIESYIEFHNMLEDLGLKIHLPLDYVKSCPYLMSYLRGYQIWNKIESATKGSKETSIKTKGKHLWLDKGSIEHYRDLPKVNARYEALKHYAFQSHAESFMWVPPTIPYYPMSGVYKCEDVKDFSKILVFSSWEMVPRMLSTLLSYEAERRVIKGDSQGHVQGYSKKHSQRLREPLSKQKTGKSAAYEALVDPDDIEWLVNLWDPVESLNASMKIGAIERMIRKKVRMRYQKISKDAQDIIVDKVLGSPAVCIARCIGVEGERYKELAKIFWDRFNSMVGTAIVDHAYMRRRDDSFYWRDVLRYCKDGCFQAMFDEYYAVIRDDVGLELGDKQKETIIEKIKAGLSLHTATYDVDCVSGRNRCACQTSMRTHFAVSFAKGRGEEIKGVERKDAIRRCFNSPMRPFVLASTSIGQEGLDFHPYCRKILHWNLPFNPIDLEQREGRINRYKCYAIRKNVALKYAKPPYEEDIWKQVFLNAENGEKEKWHSDLVPFWCFGKNQEVKIERIFPMYPCSRDEEMYSRLIKVLSLYRLSMGQPRQEELLEHVVREWSYDELKKLFLDLSPFSRKKK